MIKFSNPLIVQPAVVKLVEKVEPQTFSRVFLAPTPFDDQSTDNFISLTDIKYDYKMLKPGETVLDCPGKTCYESTFTIDSETAIKANVRKARYAFYLTNPNQRKIKVDIDSRTKIGSTSYYNQRAMAASTRSSTKTHAASSMSTSKAIQPSPITKRQAPASSKYAEIAPMSARGKARTFGSSLSIQDGRIREIEVDLGITDQMVTDYNLWKTMQSVSPVRVESAPPLPEQTYVIQATDAFDIRTSEVRSAGIPIKNTQSTMPTYSAEAVHLERETDPVQVAQTVMFQDQTPPDDYMNGFYGSGPGAGTPAPNMPVQYSIHGHTMNQTIKKSFQTVDTFKSVQSSQPRNATQQPLQRKVTDSSSFRQQVRDAITAPIETVSRAFDTVSRLTEYVFKSSVLEFETDFDFTFEVLDPRTEKFYVKMELLGADGSVLYDKLYTVNLREQLEPLLIPASPPNISMFEYGANKGVISIEQTDPVASSVSVYRMMSSLETLTEATWQSVGDLTINEKNVGSQINDTDLRDNYDPKIVIYEARCSGPFGGTCPVTSTIIQKGVALDPVCNLPSDVKGEITITAEQVDTEFKITVSDIPDSVFRIALKRQVINNSQNSDDNRTHPYIKRSDGGDRFFTDCRSLSGPIEYVDGGFFGGAICKYYAVIDWKDGRRTYSITEEYIQYINPPPPVVSSYMNNVEIDVTSSRKKVSFDYGASLTSLGIDSINTALGETGTAALFTQELQKDRSLITNLLLSEVSRKDMKTGEIVTWPLKDSGRFTDSMSSNRSMGLSIPALESGRTYVYTVKIYVLNPEQVFSEAMTRIPASTRQLITDSDPNFVEVSARRFAANFTAITQDMQPASMIGEKSSVQEKVSAGYTGLSHRSTIKIPEVRAQVRKPKTSRKTSTGRPANVISWDLDGRSESIYAFKVDVVLDGGLRMPLASISPNSVEGKSFSFRDENFVHENTPVSYEVSAVYMDQRTSKVQRTESVEGGISKNSKIADRALSKQSRIDSGYTPKPSLTSGEVKGKVSNVERVAKDLKASSNLYAGPTSISNLKDTKKKDQQVKISAQQKVKQQSKSVEKKRKLNKNETERKR